MPPPCPPPPALRESVLSTVDLDFLDFAGMSALALMIVYFIYTCYERKYSHRRTTAESGGSSGGGPSTAVICTRLFQYGERGIVGKNADCSICLDEFTEGEVCRMLPKCKHIFHRFCIDQWLPNERHCPLCRSPVHVRIIYSHQS